MAPVQGSPPYAEPYGESSDCRDISGTYRANSDERLLPFLLFGVLDTESAEWNALVDLTSQLRGRPDEAVVTIRSPDAERLEVQVIVRGVPKATQGLTRSHRSPTATEWLGQGERTFRCERDAVAITGTQIVAWDEYLLPESEKNRRYRRPGTNDVGTARGVYRFSKAADGSLLAHQTLYFCLGACRPVTGGRWEAVRETPPPASGG